MEEKITISDIARESGVSTATVSLVLNNRPGISQQTRLKVLEVAEKLEYALKPSSSTRAGRPLTTIGMVVKTDPTPPQENAFYSKVIVGIEEGCRRNGINLLFATLPVDENNHPVEVPQLLNKDLVDGLLMVGTFVDETLTSFSGKHTPPIVLVDGYSDTESYDAVVSDNFRAAHQAVEYLIQKGHRQIGMIGGDTDCYPSLKERRNGYLRALKENEIADVYLANFNLNQSHGYQETLALLKEHPQVTALFCVNDEVANSALRAAQSLGLNVPQDLSVIGYDDTLIAANAHPPLTTLHVDTVAMGRAAVNLLSMRIEHPESARMTLTIHPTLIERESVGCPKN
jgi:LacI family transcriptional regulator